jgi:hypothetical protein
MVVLALVGVVSNVLITDFVHVRTPVVFTLVHSELLMFSWIRIIGEHVY